MSREAMKLALEALDIVKIHFTQNRHVNDAITVLREALAKPDFWEGYVPEPVKPAQQALDKKAENARELGLDYEPVWGGGPTNKDYEDAMRQKRLHQLTSPPAQQESWLLETTQTLAKNLAREFYPEVTQWECLNDLAGVISQIDNMTTGLMRKPAQQEPLGPEPFGYFQYDIRLDAWVQNRVNNKGVAFYIKEKK